MDLDQWISKVKDGQHLSEDELQLLCEYVRHLLLLLACLLDFSEALSFLCCSLLCFICIYLGGT